MCLYIYSSVTLKGKKVDKNGMIKVWKVLSQYEKGELTSPLRPSLSCVWKPGWIHSNRTSSKLLPNEKHDKCIYRGIHVVLTRQDARKYSKTLNSNSHHTKVIPVYVKKKDFVAAGMGYLVFAHNCYTESRFKTAAVFNKVYLKKEDYNKAVKRKKFGRYKRT